jgi:hypothetical protein
MTQLRTRQTLTDLAAHMRETYGRDAAALVELWRDQRFPESTTIKHRWSWLNRRHDGMWINRECKRCGLIDQFGRMPDGKEAKHFVLPDGSILQKSPNPTPPCRPLTHTNP